MSDLPRLAFIHLPKTGGTSVRAFLQDVYQGETFPGNTTLDYANYTNDQLDSYRFYSGHAYRKDIIRLPQDTLLFTIFRNPVWRAMSLYRFYRQIRDLPDDVHMREAINTAKSANIVDFIYSDCPFLIEHLQAGQIRQFLDQDVLNELGHRRKLTVDVEDRVWENFVTNLQAFQYVFVSEWLDLSIPYFAVQLGLRTFDRPLGRANVSRHEDGIDEMAVRRAVYDTSPLDCRAYDYALLRQRDFARSWLQGSPP